MKQVDEKFVEINQSHISFQNMFNQISLKEICEEGLISISKQGSVSFENQHKSKYLLQCWYTPNVTNKSGTELSYIKIGRLFLAKQRAWVVMSIFRKAYNKWRLTECCKVPVEKKGTILLHSTLVESGALNGSYMLPYQNTNKKDKG